MKGLGIGLGLGSGLGLGQLEEPLVGNGIVSSGLELRDSNGVVMGQ